MKNAIGVLVTVAVIMLLFYLMLVNGTFMHGD